MTVSVRGKQPVPAVEIGRRWLSRAGLSAVVAAATFSLAVPSRAEGLRQAMAAAYQSNPKLDAERAKLRATDEDGRSLSFSNVSLSGGFAALYRDTHEERDNHVCHIDGIKCWADEARFGGIVIQPLVEEI